MLTPYEEELLVGTRIAERYQVLGVVGKGSMGIVYKARHELMGRLVAIKMLRGQLQSDERSVKRFEREAKAASRLDHPNVIVVHDFGLTENRQPYIVMDFVQGVTLYEILKREGRIGAERAVHVFSQVCDALHHAHLQGVIHRDLKPSNVMLVTRPEEPELVKVFDLGVAKIAWKDEYETEEALTNTGEVCGSPVYLSPEQCLHGTVDHRTDIYSLGVMMYELLTGMPPLMGETVYDTIYMHVHQEPAPFREVAPDLTLPSRLERIVMKALSKSLDERYQSMQELKWELQAALQESDPQLRVMPPDMLHALKKRGKFDDAPYAKEHDARTRPAVASDYAALQGANPGLSGGYNQYNRGNGLPTPDASFDASTRAVTPSGQFGAAQRAFPPNGQMPNPGVTPAGQFNAANPALTPPGQYNAANPALTPPGQYNAANPALTPPGQYSAVNPALTPPGQYNAANPALTPPGQYNAANPALTPQGQFNAAHMSGRFPAGPNNVGGNPNASPSVKPQARIPHPVDTSPSERLLLFADQKLVQPAKRFAREGMRGISAAEAAMISSVVSVAVTACIICIFLFVHQQQAHQPPITVQTAQVAGDADEAVVDDTAQSTIKSHGQSASTVMQRAIALQKKNPTNNKKNALPGKTAAAKATEMKQPGQPKKQPPAEHKAIAQAAPANPAAGFFSIFMPGNNQLQRSPSPEQHKQPAEHALSRNSSGSGQAGKQHATQHMVEQQPKMAPVENGNDGAGALEAPPAQQLSPRQPAQAPQEQQPPPPVHHVQQAVLMHNAGVALMQEHPSMAIEKFKEALQLDPSYTHARQNLGLSYYNNANQLWAAGDIPAADHNYQLAISNLVNSVGNNHPQTQQVRQTYKEFRQATGH